MKISDSDKVSILLKALEIHEQEIRRRDEIQQKLFEWSTGLLITIFGAIIAYSSTSPSLQYPLFVKSLATILIVVPITLFATRIQGHRQTAARSASTVERIEGLLNFYENDFYGDQSPYPKSWKGNYAKAILKGPSRYAIILLLMTVCVVAAIWSLL